MPRLPNEIPLRRPAYFWWLLANILAACFAVVSWMACLYLFRNIEVPGNYEFLDKLGRLPVRKAVEAERPPEGVAMGPLDLYRRFYGLNEEDAGRLNGLMVRNYLNNFSRPHFLTYVEGDYRVKSARPLTGDDFIPSGIVASAQAMVRPDDASAAAPYPVWIEMILPGAPPEMAAELREGDLLRLRRNPTCVAVLHACKVKSGGDELLWITVMPLTDGPWQDLGDRQPIPIEVPAKLRPRAGLPIMKNP